MSAIAICFEPFSTSAVIWRYRCSKMCSGSTARGNSTTFGNGKSGTEARELGLGLPMIAYCRRPCDTTHANHATGPRSAGLEFTFGPEPVFDFRLALRRLRNLVGALGDE